MTEQLKLILEALKKLNGALDYLKEVEKDTEALLEAHIKDLEN